MVHELCLQRFFIFKSRIKNVNSVRILFSMVSSVTHSSQSVIKGKILYFIRINFVLVVTRTNEALQFSCIMNCNAYLFIDFLYLYTVSRIEQLLNTLKSCPPLPSLHFSLLVALPLTV